MRKKYIVIILLIVFVSTCLLLLVINNRNNSQSTMPSTFTSKLTNVFSSVNTAFDDYYTINKTSNDTVSELVIIDVSINDLNTANSQINMISLPKPTNGLTENTISKYSLLIADLKTTISSCLIFMNDAKLLVDIPNASVIINNVAKQDATDCGNHHAKVVTDINNIHL